ncbi:MAG: hypothetical protein JF607_03695 [Burkholderiales bacterium]|jgi:hypothetical protein|nr:hypothetical protein [Burkholderiales bacterium]
MNTALEYLARDLHLADRDSLGLAFGHACVQRVRHLLEDADVIRCLDTLGDVVAGRADENQLTAARAEAARLANHHPGSKSIDGCGHAAVSASYAVAKALEGKGLQAASYAAYATVYAQGGAAAVAERESFDAEFGWQCDCLARLAAQSARPMPTASSSVAISSST